MDDLITKPVDLVPAICQNVSERLVGSYTAIATQKDGAQWPRSEYRSQLLFPAKCNFSMGSNSEDNRFP